ncbi:Hypothetical protein NTJ_10288 [Nesidiocoris tenuis]|nr:Hypothetical protein NTJ_10288 [Nesidiocoris tenuis]
MDSKRFFFTIAVASLAWLLLFKFRISDAQVTFSRDWNAGKRSMSLSECSAPMRSATSVCQLLVNELRAIANCEVRRTLLASRPEEGNESAADVFLAQAQRSG